MRNVIIGSGIIAVLITLGLFAAAVEGVDLSQASSGKSPAAGQKAQPAANHRGLAYRYPGDVGIETDSAVVFHETFEKGDVQDLSQNWTSISNKDDQILDFVNDAPSGSAGKRSLRMTATDGHDTGGHLWKYLDKGYDRLYARFYTKFSPDHPYVHHFVHMGSQREPTYPSGGAGFRRRRLPAAPAPGPPEPRVFPPVSISAPQDGPYRRATGCYTATGARCAVGRLIMGSRTGG